MGKNLRDGDPTEGKIKWLNKSRCGNRSVEKVKFSDKFWNNKNIHRDGL